MNLKEIGERMQKLEGWSISGANIDKDFWFENFKEAVVFVNKVAEISEKCNHHPQIVINYKTVKLMLTTHSEHGLTEKDFDVAEEIDKLTNKP